MPRPSRHMDEKLIRAALALLPVTGYSGLSLRAVAAKAGVNLGMFNYHFRNKEDFLRRVASEFYEAFFEKITLEMEMEKNPEEQLRRVVLNLAQFARDHRWLLLALGRDVLEGDQKLARMMGSLIPRHGVILVRLIRECKRTGLIADIPLPVVIPFILGSLVGPIMMMTVLERVNLRHPLDAIKKRIISYLLTDSVIEQRLELAFRALEPGRSWKSSNPELDGQVEAMLTPFRERSARTAGAVRKRPASAAGGKACEKKRKPITR